MKWKKIFDCWWIGLISILLLKVIYIIAVDFTTIYQKLIGVFLLSGVLLYFVWALKNYYKKDVSSVILLEEK